MNEKVLLVAQGFPPMKSMGSFRNYKIANEYLKYFSKVSVITPTDKSSWPSDSAIDIEAFDLNEVGSACLHSAIGKCPDSIKFDSRQRQSVLANLVRKLVRSFPFNFLVNGGGLRYILEGYERGKELIKKEKIGYIHTSYPPMTDHIIGWLLKKKYPHLIWITDFRDLMVEDMRKDVVFPWLQDKFIERLISKADIVITVSEGLAKHLRDYGKNVCVLFNGIPKGIQKLESNKQLKFTCTYTGSIYKNLQKPQLFLEAIASLIEEGKILEEKFQFVYRGKDVHLWQELIAENNLQEIFNASPSKVSVAQSRILQNDSHINLLLSWASKDFKGILTGKMYDYMAAGKPVALIMNGVYDEEFETIFRKTNLGKIFYHEKNDVEQIKQFILKYYQEWIRKASISPVVNQEELEVYKIENIVKNFVTNTLKVQGLSNTLEKNYLESLGINSTSADSSVITR